MKQLHYCLGLPRTCSTVLMNILNENPKIFTTSTCPVPYLIKSCHETLNNTPDFASLDKDLLHKSYISFLREGMRGWYENMTDKPIVFSKSRLWSEYFHYTFSIDSNSKYLVILRDLREIICSFESLLWKYPEVRSSTKPFNQLSFEERMEIYCTDESSLLGRPLSILPHVMEIKQKNPNNFYILCQEDFNDNPREVLQNIYVWLGQEHFEHNLDNIAKSGYYEHDNVYRSLVSHKVRKKLEKLETRWKKIMTKEQSNLVISNNRWYYETFYPEEL
tara:strand:+ start:262 stop:1089 length:828 start_codon:yes stop_codon:yes gene_type:complete